MMKKLVSKLATVFSRQTLSTRYIPELDGLRCVAVLMVLFFHLNGYMMEKNGWSTQLPWLTPILGNGFFGVEVFFVISGYIILLPFVPQPGVGRKRPDLLVFYVRRMVRIWPPYAIAVTVFLLSLAVKKGGLGQYMPGYFASLGYVHNVLFGTTSRIVVVAWTLEIEMQFYLLAPLLAMVFLIKRKQLRWSVIGLAIVATSLLAPRCQLGLNVLLYLQYFLCGLLLADLGVAEGSIKRSVAVDLVAIGLIPFLVWSVAAQGPLGIWVPTLLMMTIAAACHGTVLSRCLSHSWARFVGGMCFSIYLLHYPVISLFGPLVKKIGSLAMPLLVSYMVQSLILTVAVLAVSAVFFVFVEKPFMKRETTVWVVALLRRLGGVAQGTRSPGLAKG
jgi:peptidoglycan/LPS O-acetylase OafA/YrhL